MADLGTASPVGVDASFWRDRSVFVTGHTGFKGGWLSLWLARLGARVTGYALEPPAEGVFRAAGLERDVRTVVADIRDAGRLTQALTAARPEVIFHLAAQPLVLRGHAAPVETFATNVMGTVHLLEAARRLEGLRAIVVVTSDKVYDNREWVWGYRERDALGGHEPYGASKACAELVVDAYRRSFFAGGERGAAVGVATARAGNVIGGGDWAEDRLVPDAIRAFRAGERLRLRNPLATRPWQHVLEPLAGYLLLAQRLTSAPEAASGAWNFGPGPADTRSVHWVADELVRLWGDGAGWHLDNRAMPHEARLLAVDSTKATTGLGWRSLWSVERALDRSVSWYRAQHHAADLRSLTIDQIEEYSDAA